MTEEGLSGFGFFEGLCPVSPDGGIEALGCQLASWELPILLIALGILALVIFAAIRRRRSENEIRGRRYVLPTRGRVRGQGSTPGAPRVVRPGPGPGPAQGQDAPRPSGSAEPRGGNAAPSAPGPGSPPPPAVDAAPAGPLSPAASPSPGGNGYARDPSERARNPAAGATAESEPADSAPAAFAVGSAHRGSQVMEEGSHPESRPPPQGEPTTGEVEGTLQLHPARMEIEHGPGKGEHIRFVRLPGGKQEVTFGRSEGHPHRHVRLDSPTVSRRHARLVFQGGTWSLHNESRTNPTLHNGRSVESVEEVALEDGDRIEMGEMSFLFRQPQNVDRLALRSSWYTDRGRRSVNQDAVIVKTLPDGRELAAVCDGVGSHSAGGTASHVALDALVGALSDGAELADAVGRANAAVLHAAEQAEDREGMGTTLVAVVRSRGRYEIANVGDSRAYRIDDAGIRQVTRDHSFVAEAVQDGRMSLEEANRSPWRNAVTRNLGASEELDVDLYDGHHGGEPFVLVLCTDGVHGVLDDEEILRVFRGTSDIRELARALGEDALINGGEDNVAVAAIRFAAGTDGASPRG